MADAKAATIKSTRVTQKRLIGTAPSAIASGEGFGRVTVSRIIIAVISTCIVRIHHLFVFITSTMGLQSPLRNQGK